MAPKHKRDSHERASEHFGSFLSDTLRRSIKAWRERFIETLDLTHLLLVYTLCIA
jgi:hypothetical protein